VFGFARQCPRRGRLFTVRRER